MLINKNNEVKNEKRSKKDKYRKVIYFKSKRIYIYIYIYILSLLFYFNF